MKTLLVLLIFLLEPLHAERNGGWDLFMQAIKDGNANALEDLLSVGFDPNQPIHGHSALFFAIQQGRADAVELLLAAHADPNALVDMGDALTPFSPSPLQLAVLYNNVRIASRLIAAGAHIEAAVLNNAVKEFQLEMIRRLIEAGADVNDRDREGASPLDVAVRSGSIDTVAILLAHRARLNEPNSQTGRTPINEAAVRGNTRVVEYLLQFHPELGISDLRGNGPLENATRIGNEDSALLLLEVQPKERQTPQFFGTAMEAAIKKDESRLIAALLRHGAAINMSLPSGSTALDAAAFEGAGKAVRVLLENGADPNLGGQYGASPLEDASMKGNDSIVSLLLDHGALVNRPNSDSGITALFAAASFGKAGVVKLLLTRGANPTLCGKNRKTPYQVALENGYSEVAAEIRAHGGTGACEP